MIRWQVDELNLLCGVIVVMPYICGVIWVKIIILPPSQILKPMMLRRLKEDVEKSLAPKEETIVEVSHMTVILMALVFFNGTSE